MARALVAAVVSFEAFLVDALADLAVDFVPLEADLEAGFADDLLGGLATSALPVLALRDRGACVDAGASAAAIARTDLRCWTLMVATCEGVGGGEGRGEY